MSCLYYIHAFGRMFWRPDNGYRSMLLIFFFMYRILILGIGLLHILSANVHRLVNQSDYCWELSPHTYFLTPGQRPQMPLTNLLIINKTGKMFLICSLWILTLLRTLLRKDTHDKKVNVSFTQFKKLDLKLEQWNQKYVMKEKCIVSAHMKIKVCIEILWRFNVTVIIKRDYIVGYRSTLVGIPFKFKNI